MNKKGFTLVELLATIAIIAIIATLAVPNIISMVSNGKTKSVISDAKEIIAQTKQYRVKNPTITEVKLKDLDIDLDHDGNKETDIDAYGNTYDKDDSKVTITTSISPSNGYKEYIYTITLKAGDHYLKYGNSNKIKEQDLENATYE